MIIDKIVFFKRFLGFLLLLLLGYSSIGSHIRAGEIVVTYIEGNDYEIKMIGYRDVNGVPILGGNQPTLNYGDGTSIEFQDAASDFTLTQGAEENGVQKFTISVRHTYSSNGNYVLSYSEGVRNNDIINMNDSGGTFFYIETLLVIDDFLGNNSSPILTVPPVDYAAVGATFIHNAGAFDPDGDSLSYKFITPRKKKGLGAQDGNVNGYKELNDNSFYTNFSEGSEQGTPPQLSMNAITGDLIWNAPGDIINQEGGEGPVLRDSQSTM